MVASEGGSLEMGETKHTTFRLPEADLRLLDKEVRRLSKELGIKVSRTDILKKLIQDNLKPGRKK